MQNSIVEFRSKDCKNNNHQNCAGSWNGFGFEVYCSCDCHHKKEEALESVGGPVVNANSLYSCRFYEGPKNGE
jgi:hypothetical protein